MLQPAWVARPHLHHAVQAATTRGAAFCEGTAVAPYRLRSHAQTSAGATPSVPSGRLLAASLVVAGVLRSRRERRESLRRSCADRRCVALKASSGVIEETPVAVDEVQATRLEGGVGDGKRNEPPPERGLIVALVAAAYVIWQMDKVNMSVAILPMAAQYGWDVGDEGLIQSSIFWGYAATQVIGGFLATKYGGKRVLLAAVTLWSTATCAAPYAAAMGTQALIASRILVGIGEGLAPAAGLSMVATWIPEEERSRAVATLGGGKTVGAIAGLLLAPVVITSFGWPVMFYSFGVLGLIWAMLWFVLGKDRPRPEGSSDEDAPIPWARILQTPQLWGVVVAHFCHDWGSYALLTWTPTYLNQALGYNLQGSSELTVIPSVLAVAVAASAGTLADKLHSEDGVELTTVRKLFQGAAFFLPGVCLTWLGTLDGIDQGSPLPIVLLTLGVAAGAASYAGLYSSHADLSAKYSGLVNGISTTFGALAGVGSNFFAGYMLKATGSYSQSIFLPAVAFYIVGWVTYTLLYDATPVDWDKEDDGK